MYPATSRRRSTVPHDANGTKTVTRAAASGRCRAPSRAMTNVPAISGPMAETRNAAFHPARVAAIGERRPVRHRDDVPPEEHAAHESGLRVGERPFVAKLRKQRGERREAKHGADVRDDQDGDRVHEIRGHHTQPPVTTRLARVAYAVPRSTAASRCAR